MIGSLATRVRELSLRVAQLEGELEAARKRVAVYEDFDTQVQDSLSAALRAANQIRERARVSAEAIAEEARAQRPASAAELEALRIERDALRRSIEGALLSPSARSAMPGVAVFPASEMRTAAAEALRGVFKELVDEIRATTPPAAPVQAPPAAAAQPAPAAVVAAQPAPVAAPPEAPAAPTPAPQPAPYVAPQATEFVPPPEAAAPPPQAAPVAPPQATQFVPPQAAPVVAPQPASSPSAFGPAAAQPAPVAQRPAPPPPAESTPAPAPAAAPAPPAPPAPPPVWVAPPRPTVVPQPERPGLVEDVDVAPAAAAPAPRWTPAPPAPVAPTAPVAAEQRYAPAVEPVSEIQVVLSPISSFPRLVELERRLQGMPVVRTVYARDFRNGVATLAIGLRHPMTVEEFAGSVTKLDYPRMRIVSTSGYVLELRIDSEASSIA
jgi:hypothetical protein